MLSLLHLGCLFFPVDLHFKVFSQRKPINSAACLQGTASTVSICLRIVWSFKKNVTHILFLSLPGSDDDDDDNNPNLQSLSFSSSPCTSAIYDPLQEESRRAGFEGEGNAALPPVIQPLRASVMPC